MANVSKRIPSNTQPTWQADINGKRYEYQSGINADVPEEVAALIDDAEAGMAKEDPRASQRGIEKDVTQIVKDNFEGGVGYEEPVEVVMLPETSFEVSKSETYISQSFPYAFEIGKEYTVTLDGETKTYTAVDNGGGFGALCNTSIDDFTDGNGWLCAAVEGVFGIMTRDASFYGTHTISISGFITTTHKIDRKYSSKESMPLYSTSSGLSLTSGGAAIEPEELADLLKNFDCYVIDIVNNYNYDEYIPILSVKAYHKNGNLVAIVCNCIRNDSIAKFTNGTVPIA